MGPYGLLDQSDEDALHASRLLNIEEKLFKRLSKRLLAPDSLLNASITQLVPTSSHLDPTAAEDHLAAIGIEQPSYRHTLWREEALLDFASFENNILRTQFLLRSNLQERQRYAIEKEKILQAAQDVRENNLLLQDRLEGAQRILELRKTYDVQSSKIIDDVTLKSRDEQNLNIQKLREEIADLERESEDYAQTWVERREQFTKIFDAGEDLLRLIRDEKEEAERKEGMDEAENVEGEPLPDADSNVGTPKPSGHISDHLPRPGTIIEALDVGTTTVINASVGASHGPEQHNPSDIEEGEEQEAERMDTT